MTTGVRSLGRGLSALLGDFQDENVQTSSLEASNNLPIDKILPGKMQPRKHFDKEKLESLASSIIQKGVLQPLLVRAIGDEKFEIIAGERRWRASQIAGLTTIPAIVVNYTDTEALEIGLIENLQRDDLNPVEEAESLYRLIQEYDKTQEEVASVIGKSRSYVANTLRLLQLPELVKNYIKTGELSSGHARTLVNVHNAEELAKSIVEQKLNVREAEALLKKQKSPAVKTELTHDAALEMDAAILSAEFTKLTGLKAKLIIKRHNAELRFSFEGLEQIDELLNKLKSSTAGDFTQNLYS